MNKAVRMMERMYRTMDFVDETLHTNNHYFVPTGLFYYGSVSEILKPTVGLLVGLFLPYLLRWLEKQGSISDTATPCYQSSMTAVIFLILT